jgi:hypothetical protein
MKDEGIAKLDELAMTLVRITTAYSTCLIKENAKCCGLFQNNSLSAGLLASSLDILIYLDIGPPRLERLHEHYSLFNLISTRTVMSPAR